MRRPQTLRKLFAIYKRQNLRGCNPNTAAKYASAIKYLEDFIGRTAKIADLNRDVIVDYLWSLKASRDIVERSVNGYRSKLLALWNFCCKNGWKKQWPDVSKWREPRYIPNAWNRAQIRKIFKSIDQETGTIGGVPARKWFRALWLFIWDGGERRNAALSPLWEDVDLKQGVVVVRYQHRKWKTRDLLIWLRKETIQAFREIQLPRRERVFEHERTQQTIVSRYKKILKRAGLPFSSKWLFQCIRRSHASHLEACGGDATVSLDHSDRKMTLEFYIDPTIAKKRPPSSYLFRPTG